MKQITQNKWIIFHHGSNGYDDMTEPIGMSITKFIKQLRNEGIRVSKSGSEYELSNGALLFQKEVEN